MLSRHGRNARDYAYRRTTEMTRTVYVIYQNTNAYDITYAYEYRDAA